MLAPLLAMLLLCVFGAAAHAVEIAANGITLPFFNDAGRLTHKLTAKRGSIAGASHKLQDVEIVYFSLKNPEVIEQRVEADEATWNETTQTLRGDGAVRVATVENKLSGEGFDFALATSQVNIHRNFQMENSELVVHANRGAIDLLVQKNGDELKVQDVKRAEAVGNLRIVVQPAAAGKYPVDRAFSEIAIYDGATGVVTLPKPVRYEQAGRPAGEAGEMTFRLKK